MIVRGCGVLLTWPTYLSRSHTREASGRSRLRSCGTFPRALRASSSPSRGSAAISLAMAARGKSESYWINDAHAPLVELWRSIIDRPDALADRYSFIWHDQLGRERTYFDHIRGQVQQGARRRGLPLPAGTLRQGCRSLQRQRRVQQHAGQQAERSQTGGDAPADPFRILPVEVQDPADFLGLTSPSWANAPTKTWSTWTRRTREFVGRENSRYLSTIARDEFCDSIAELARMGIMFAVSYDGRTGDKTYGEPLPDSLGLTHLEIRAGRSTQATLLGRDDITYESLYLVSRAGEPGPCRTANEELPEFVKGVIRTKLNTPE